MFHMKLNINQVLVIGQLLISSFLKFVSDQLIFHNYSKLILGSSSISKEDVEKPFFAASEESFDLNYEKPAVVDAESKDAHFLEEIVQDKAMSEKAYLDILKPPRSENFHSMYC